MYKIVVLIGCLCVLGMSFSVCAYTEGLISGFVLNSYEYDAQEGMFPCSIKVGEDATYTYIAIISTGDSGTEYDGYVRTVKVEKATGIYTASLIDYLEFDTSDCYGPSICNVGTGYYAISYCDAGASKQTIVTVSIDSVGDVGNAVTDTQTMTYDGIDSASRSSIIQISGTTYLIAYTVSDGDGWFETYTISTSGVITNAVIDTQEFDTANGYYPVVVLTDSDTVACIYETTDTGSDLYRDGNIVTYNVSSGGTITNTQADAYEYSTDVGTNPDISQITGEYFVISYEGTANDGYIASFRILSGWDIQNSLIDTIEYDTADGGYQSLFLLGLSSTANTYTYALTYQGTSGDGFIGSFWIDNVGVMTRTALNNLLEYDTTDTLYYADLIYNSKNIWSIVYMATGNDGFVISIMIDNEFDLTTYENIVNTKGTHQTQTTATGYKVWANYTTNMMLREILNSYLYGTHQYLWNSTTGNMMVWANYSGADLSIVAGKHEGNFTASGSYSAYPVNRWVVSLIIDDNINTIENIVDATGTHEDKEIVSYYSASDYLIKHYSNWSVWANYTGDTTPLNLFENIGYSFGTHEFNLVGGEYNVWANYTSALTKSENIVDATGTHESLYDPVGNTWRVWANYTGDIPPSLRLYLYENFVNSTGTHQYNLNATGYQVWANVTGNTSSNVTVDNSSETWLWISGLSLNSGELGLTIVFLLFSLVFIIKRPEDMVWKPILLFIDTPLSLATGIFYVGNTLFSIQWWVGVGLIVFAVLLSMGGLYYALTFGRHGNKEK